MGNNFVKHPDQFAEFRLSQRIRKQIRHGLVDRIVKLDDAMPFLRQMNM